MRPPAHPEVWDGVRDVMAYGPTVPKPPYPRPYDELLPEPVIAGDDCLNLNVWTPDPGQAGLPVMVWIHGGAFVNGSGAVAHYAGDRFARDVSVAALLSMSAAGGLFRKAIAQSGAGHHVLSAGTARLVTAELARRLGVAATREDFGAVPVDGLIAAQRQLSEDIALNPDPGRWREIAANMMAFEPVVDGQLLPVRPIDGIAGGNGRHVDLLVGTNQDEHRLLRFSARAGQDRRQIISHARRQQHGSPPTRARMSNGQPHDPARRARGTPPAATRSATGAGDAPSAGPSPGRPPATAGSPARR